MKYKNTAMVCILGIAVLVAISFAENLQGCVRDETGQPVPYASVAVIDENKGTIAGENGCFTIPGLQNRGSYTLRITSIGYLGFSGSAKTGEINSFTLRQDAVVLGETVITARRPGIRAILRANIVNDATFYGNSIDASRRDTPIPLYFNDYIDFNGEESYYDIESQRIVDEDFAWYFMSGYDADVFDDMINRETPVQQYRSFLEGFKFNSPEKVVEGRKIARWQFREDPYQPFSRTSFAILEVRYLNGVDYDYGYYIQRVDVDASNVRFCYPERPCADTSRAAVYQPITGICAKDSDCSPNVCDAFTRTCVPANYEQRACKITSNAHIYDRLGNRIENPFASPLFPQIASASPLQKAQCLSDTMIRVPVCSITGVTFEEKECPEGTKCFDESGEGVCIESLRCKNIFTLDTNDDCFFQDALCIRYSDGDRCSPIKDIGPSEMSDILIAAFEKETDEVLKERIISEFRINRFDDVRTRDKVKNFLVTVINTSDSDTIKSSAVSSLRDFYSGEIMSMLMDELKKTSSDELKKSILYTIDTFTRDKKISQDFSRQIVIDIAGLYSGEENLNTKYEMIGAVIELNRVYKITGFYSLISQIRSDYITVLNYHEAYGRLEESEMRNLIGFYIHGDMDGFESKNDCSGSTSRCLGITSQNGFSIRVNPFGSLTFYNYGGIKSIEIGEIYDNTVIRLIEGTLMVTISKDGGKIVGDASKLRSQLRFVSNGQVRSCPQDCTAENPVQNRGYQVVLMTSQISEAELNRIRLGIQDRYGVTPKRYFGLIDSADMYEGMNMFFDASEYVSSNAQGIQISPSFLFTIAVGEGLYLFLDSKGDINQPISGFSYLGVDTFSSEIDSLMSRGFLEPEFSGYTEASRQNEFGETVRSANFDSLGPGLKALGAVLANRQFMFLEDARRVGLSKYDFNEDELNFWTYAYFNNPCFSRGHLLNREGATFSCRVGSGSRTYTSEGRAFFSKWIGEERTDIRSVRYNSILRVATWKYIEESGIFNINQLLASS